jgi:phosphatidylglycerophosphate synthase
MLRAICPRWTCLAHVTLLDDTNPIPAGTVPALAAGMAGVVLAGAGLAATTALGPAAATAAAVTYAIAGAIVVATIARSHRATVFGAPNIVTLARVAATALVTGYTVDVLSGLAPSAGLATAFAALAGLAILADGIDGWLARTRGPATAFGARFDMEVDALLLLALSVLAFGLGKAGAWVILIGAMRYVFVLAGILFPWLDAPLPPSFRRKAVCVVQGGVLTALALPVVSGSFALALAVVALAALAWSFAVDVAWLAVRRPRPQ